MSDEYVKAVGAVWIKVKKGEQISKEEVNKAIKIYYENIGIKDFKIAFDAKYGIAAHRIVINDLNDFINDYFKSI